MLFGYYYSYYTTTGEEASDTNSQLIPGVNADVDG
jgi:hypothetical protein